MKTNFVLSSPYLERIRSFESGDTFCLYINGYKIELPLATAICLSDVIRNQYVLDSTNMTLVFQLELKTEKDSIDQFRDILNGIPVTLNNNSTDLYILGKSIGNSEIASLAFVGIEETIDNSNVLDIIQMKLDANINPVFEINYIAKNFMEIENINKWFLVQASKSVEVCQSILSSKDLVILSEDWLIDFIIKLCAENPACDHLLGCVYLEYASLQGVAKFVDFVNTRELSISVLHEIWLASGRRLKMEIVHRPEKLPRHQKNSIRNSQLYEPNNPCKGILYDLGRVQAVNVSASSVSAGSPDDLITGADGAHFFTQDKPGSWVLFTFPNNTIIPKSYMIRGSLYGDDDNQLQSWTLEGLNMDDEWEILDKQKRKPFHQLEIREFPIPNPFEIKSLRLTNTERSVEGGNRLCISQFELFGDLYTNES